jgi:peptide/nickel transport system ATP-binding protein
MEYKIRQLTVQSIDRSKHILEDIDLDILGSERIGILGPSGSGKSQLGYALGRLNMYYGLLCTARTQQFENTEISLDLRIEQNLTPFRQKYFAYIFQDAAAYFNPLLKIKTQLEVMKHPGKELESMLEKLGFSDPLTALQSYPHQLSGGQLQRLAILHALIRRPSILVADEMDSSLDEENAQKALGLIGEQQNKAGFAFVWISHDQPRTKSQTNRILSISNGRIVQDLPSKVFDPISFTHPKDVFSFPGEEIIRLEYAQKVYFKPGTLFNQKKFVVLDSVNFSIYSNETIGIIGRSGAGKSTLAKILAGMEKLTKGTIYLKGQRRSRHVPSPAILYLFQDAFSSLNPSQSVQQILTEALAASLAKQIPMQEILDWCQLEASVLSLRSVQLSGGMRQRLALGRAYAVRPQVLILDESLNAMDPELVYFFLEKLADFQHRFKTAIVHISHRAELLHAVCSTVYRLEEGQLTSIKQSHQKQDSL